MRKIKKKRGGSSVVTRKVSYHKVVVMGLHFCGSEIQFYQPGVLYFEYKPLNFATLASLVTDRTLVIGFLKGCLHSTSAASE
jgi:hypothetical protein